VFKVKLIIRNRVSKLKLNADEKLTFLKRAWLIYIVISKSISCLKITENEKLVNKLKIKC